MTAHTVTLLPGDGIGPEVVEAAVGVVAAAGVDVRWEVHQVGAPALDRGADSPLPEAVVESIRRNRFALKGPVSTAAGRSAFRSVNVELRRRLGLYAQARRCRSWPGLPTASPPMDVVVIRETTEDLYAGVEAGRGTEAAAAVIDAMARAGQEIPPEAGLSLKFTTEHASRRAVELAFRHAREEGRRRVTVAHKATVMRETDGVFVEVARQVAEANPDIDFDDCLVDNLCARLVRDAGELDVLVMPNMYGDIVSDLAAALAGGVGLVPGVNVGDGAVLFEPGHGSAPKYAGLGRADPVATILCAALLVRALGEPAAADAIERAVGDVIADGTTLTYDLKASRDDPAAASTSAMADAVAARLS